MGKDFTRVTTTTDIPVDKTEQVRIILEGRVRDALYGKFMSTAPLARVTDYSSFFTVSLQDLREYIRTHADEVDRLLPWESGKPRAGMGIFRKPSGIYEIREHDDHGVVRWTEETHDLALVIDKWLKVILLNQGLGSLAAAAQPPS